MCINSGFVIAQFPLLDPDPDPGPPRSGSETLVRREMTNKRTEVPKNYGSIAVLDHFDLWRKEWGQLL